MWHKNNKFMRIISGLLVICLLFSYFSGTEVEAKSKPPKFNAAMTDKNMLKLVKAYDSDAYYILSKTKKKGDSFAVWLSSGSNLADAADVTVHEQFHSYTHSFGKFSWSGGFSDKYYIGNKKNVYVSYTDVFKTEVATRKIPSEYRTFRYSTYVSEGAKASSNMYGVYGLLNEFTAYYWGMHVDYSLYPYYKANEGEASWYKFESNYSNNKDAYAEFYYWTLVYLEYARVHKKKVYKAIMKNKNYIKTFNKIQTDYVKLMKKYEKKLDIIYNENYGYSYTSSRGEYGTYNVLMGQINSSKYKKVRNDIKKYAKKYK